MANAVTTEAALPVVTENSAARWGSSVSVARRLAALANAASDSRNTARLVMRTAIIREKRSACGKHADRPAPVAGEGSGAAFTYCLHKYLRPNILSPGTAITTS